MMNDRIVVLVDMDCFYCQVEARYDPSLKGKPMAVVQYNQWQGGGIIAVNYEARAFGVTRHIRGNEAKKKCPDIVLVHVPSVRGKADLTRYRDAGREVVDVLCQFSDTVQRASVDEAYLDITQAVNLRHKKLNGVAVKPEELLNTFVIGSSPEDSNDEDERKKGIIYWLNGIYHSEFQDETSEKLAVAALIVEEMRAAVFESTGFRCSAGIAHNKILSKLACGLHKPQRQTVLPQSGISILYRSLPIHKVRGLGGKFGDLVKKRLNINFMGELLEFPEVHLQKTFDEKSGSWLYNIARGFDDEAVTARLTSKSIGCCKKFPGKLALATRESVEHWLGELADEVAERLQRELAEGSRKATQFVVSYMQTIDGRDVSSSRCGSLTSLETKQIFVDAMELLKRSNSVSSGSSWVPPLKFLGLSAGKFTEKDAKSATIQNFFKSVPKKEDTSHIETKPCEQDKFDTIHEKIEHTETLNTYEVNNDFDEHAEFKNKELDMQDDICREEVFRNNSSVKSENTELFERKEFRKSSDKVVKQEVTPKASKKKSSKTRGNSSSKNSFLFSFFKQEGLIRTPTSIKRSSKSATQNNKNCNEDSATNRGSSDEGHVITPTAPTGKSQEPTTSDGYCGITNRSIRLLQVDDSSNDSDKTVQHWVSPSEIFPNLDDIDNDLAALLPTPLRQQLHTRLQKHHEMRSDKKNKGIAKSKSKKCLTYNDQSESVVNKLTTAGLSDDIVENNFTNKIPENTDSNEMVTNLSQEDIFAYSSLDSKDNELKIELMKTSAEMSNKGIPSDTTPVDDCQENASVISFKKSDECQVMLELSPVKNICSDSGMKNSQLKNDSQVSESLKELCPHCHQLIHLLEYPEHLDFHIAADLDRELNRLSSATKRDVVAVPQGGSPKKDSKRKRGRPGQKQTLPSDKKMRSITNFFAPVR